ncbi:sensor histidine kinase [Natronorubrum sp. JWXQ-INN-674]|uniref:histidine kinase n=2 Tax=Natronorubrum halalkaliphilum TaxID=2691917 RepID=A0A6B0VS36_9EURY|nr:sensor histidine kinase [Natronorubrum halalkaliphilum]
MTTDEAETHGEALPLERYLDPALSYAIGDERPVIVDANGPFEDRFGTVSTETPLSTVFDDAEITVRDSSLAFPDCLLDDGGCTVRVEPAATSGTRYLARAIPPAEETIGYVLFVETSGDDEPARLAMDPVASVVSHDLRNPLDVAKARLRAGRETGDDEHLERVARAHDRMERIIEDVLTLARSEDVIDPGDAVDLEAAAEAVWETVETDETELRFDDSLPTVTADRDRVDRLFENLFRNAIEHGGTHPQITVGVVGSDGFYVADDGPGIDPDHREAVFEPGFTAGDTGTGLGLAIVERIATAHGWSVAVTDAERGGARVEITGLETR